METPTPPFFSNGCLALQATRAKLFGICWHQTISCQWQAVHRGALLGSRCHKRLWCHQLVTEWPGLHTSTPALGGRSHFVPGPKTPHLNGGRLSKYLDVVWSSYCSPRPSPYKKILPSQKSQFWRGEFWLFWIALYDVSNAPDAG